MRCLVESRQKFRSPRYQDLHDSKFLAKADSILVLDSEGWMGPKRDSDEAEVTVLDLWTEADPELGQEKSWVVGRERNLLPEVSKDSNGQDEERDG